MPKLFRIGQYIVYFWSNENGEPIHVHIAEGTPRPNATKIWLTKSGGCIVANNNSGIPIHKLNAICEVISAQYFLIVTEWKEHFCSDATFFC